MKHGKINPLRRGVSLAVPCVFLLGWPAAGAEHAAAEPSYEACMQLVESDPQKGLEYARSWMGRRKARAARHCAAVASARLGDLATAAQQLEALAWDMPGETPGPARAQLLAQAAQAWLDARKPDAAHALYSAAADLAPADAEIRIDKAVALAATGRYQDAIVDLSAALITDPRSLDALVLRASAYRAVGRLDAARRDIERALALKPDQPDALLERGNLRWVSGDAGGARNDWRKLSRMHPTTPAAAAARRNLKEGKASPASPPAAAR
jgi:tetratricopeptide (TPR) repeat protein